MRTNGHTTFVVGDVHGHLAELLGALSTAGLVDDEASWCGGASHLWFLGDFVDRGPDGIAVIELVMRLEKEAEKAGGHVEALLGNHEILLLGMHHFGETEVPSDFGARSFARSWEMNGGQPTDQEQVTAEHVEWLSTRPALARVGEHLLMHSDTIEYLVWGADVDEINAGIREVLDGNDIVEWWEVWRRLTTRHAFRGEHGGEIAEQLLSVLGGRQVVHGHSVIADMLGVMPADIEAPHEYANGRVLGVDGGVFVGGPCLVVPLPFNRSATNGAHHDTPTEPDAVASAEPAADPATDSAPAPATGASEEPATEASEEPAAATDLADPTSDTDPEPAADRTANPADDTESETEPGGAAAAEPAEPESADAPEPAGKASQDAETAPTNDAEPAGVASKAAAPAESDTEPAREASGKAESDAEPGGEASEGAKSEAEHAGEASKDATPAESGAAPAREASGLTESDAELGGKASAEAESADADTESGGEASEKADPEDADTEPGREAAAAEKAGSAEPGGEASGKAEPESEAEPAGEASEDAESAEAGRPSEEADHPH